MNHWQFWLGLLAAIVGFVLALTALRRAAQKGDYGWRNSIQFWGGEALLLGSLFGIFGGWY